MGTILTEFTKINQQMKFALGMDVNENHSFRIEVKMNIWNRKIS